MFLTILRNVSGVSSGKSSPFQCLFPLPAKIVQRFLILAADITKHVFGAQKHADFRIFLAGEIERLRHSLGVLKVKVVGYLAVIADGIGSHSRRQSFQQC